MQKTSRKITIRKFESFEEAAEFDLQTYANMSDDEKLAEFLYLLQTGQTDDGRITRVATKYPLGKDPGQS